MANLVLKNFIWRIESIVPTCDIVGKRFLNFDPLRIDPDESSGMTRAFFVEWMGSDADQEPTDLTNRIAEHNFAITIAYSTDYKLNTLQEIVTKDRHDINKALRVPSSFVGYSDSPSASIGLYSRFRTVDTLEKTDTVTWYLKQTWRCLIAESEI